MTGTGIILMTFPIIKTISTCRIKNYSIIAQLSAFDEFSKEQVNEIILASVSNSQIYWIAKDQDVNETLTKIAKTHHKLIDSDILEKFIEIYDETPDFEE